MLQEFKLQLSEVLLQQLIDLVDGLQTEDNKVFSAKDIEKWINTRILIIDEISFMSCKKLIRLDKNLRKLTENYSEKFGGLDIIFCGDFCQLEPLNTSNDNPDSEIKPIYYASGHAKTLWHKAINCFIELKGLHRFNEDKAWGRI